MAALISKFIPVLLELIMKSIKPEQIEKVADKALDWCENAIQNTENEYDNQIVLPLIAIVREAFEIEDND